MSLGADARIVIIGCGISGIAAAHRLIKAGFNHVRVLEATGRSGGRIKTGKFGEYNGEPRFSRPGVHFVDLMLRAEFTYDGTSMRATSRESCTPLILSSATTVNS